MIAEEIESSSLSYVSKIFICHSKPKKDKFLIGKNKIIVLNESELIQVPQLMDMGS
jgi:hypothetical protein